MWIYTFNIDLKSRHHALLTITNCPTLISLEKEGTGREKRICQELEPKLMAFRLASSIPDQGDSAQSTSPDRLQRLLLSVEFRLDR